MKRKLLLVCLLLVAFSAGIQFQRLIGVGAVVDRFVVRRYPLLSETSHPRLAALAVLPAVERKIVFLGDSLIDLQEWDEAFGNAGVVNRGVAGAAIDDVTGRYDLSNAKAIFCLVGVNDLGRGIGREEFTARYQKYLDSLPADVPVYSLSIPAVRKYGNRQISLSLIEQCNEFIRDATVRRGGVFLDIFPISKKEGAAFFVSDGVHFSPSGYREVIRILMPYVEKEAA